MKKHSFKGQEAVLFGWKNTAFLIEKYRFSVAVL